jgi:hypothetical protein
MYSADDIYIYIFSWKRVSHQSPDLYRAVASAFPHVYFINCDEHFTPPEDIPSVIQLDDRYYYGGQFQAAIQNIPAGKILCCITGDVNPEADWKLLCDHTVTAFNTGKIGVYAPNVDYTDHPGRNERLWDNLYDVKNTDCTCWFLHPAIVNDLRLIPYMELTNMGWGIDAMFIHEARRRGLLVARDYDILLIQPRGRGYSSNEGGKGARRLLQHYSKLQHA